jgi:predicted RNase H-like HicB family nuclease
VPEIPFQVIVVFDKEDGGYAATTPSLAGVVGQVKTKQEAVRDLQEALDFTVHDMLSKAGRRVLLEGSLVDKSRCVGAGFGAFGPEKS